MKKGNTLKAGPGLRRLATTTARAYLDEFPCDTVYGGGDWDAAAWAIDRAQLGREEREGDWTIYRDALHAEIARIAARRGAG